MDKTNQDKDFSDLIENLKSKFGEGAIMLLGNQKNRQNRNHSFRRFFVRFGFRSWRSATRPNRGNLRSGNVGQKHAHSPRHCRTPEKGGKAAYIDAEHAFDIDYAKKLGVKTDDLLLSQPDCGEDALNILESLVRSGMIDLVVVDSVAALTPRAEIEGEMGDQFMGLQARMMGQAMRKLTAIASKSKTVIIFINQIRMKIGIMFGNPETTPGGRALKFFSSIRIDIRAKAKLKKAKK